MRRMNILSWILKPLGWVFGSKLRLIITMVLIAVLGFGGYKVLGQKQTQVQYQTAQAEKGTLISSVTASGTISSGNSSSITTQATGTVASVYVKDGDAVTQGQKIADITLDLSGSQKQAAAYASYVSASDSLLNSQNSLRGAEASLEKILDDIHLAHGTTEAAEQNETVTEKQARTAAEVAKDNAFNGVKTAQAQISSAALSLQLASGTIIAPSAGTVSGLSLIPGTLIVGSSSSSSSSSTTSTSYGSISQDQVKTQAKVNLSEIDVTKVKINQKATMTLDAFADKTFTGKITAIDTNGAVSSGVTTYPATITFDTLASNIYPNMGVSATIQTQIEDNVLLVPSAAVTTTSGQPVVRILRNNQPQSVDVTVGDSNDTQTVVTSGLNEGDQVVTGTTGGTATRTTGTTTTSPFGGGLNRGFGGAGGGATRVIQR